CVMPVLAESRRIPTGPPDPLGPSQPSPHYLAPPRRPSTRPLRLVTLFGHVYRHKPNTVASSALGMVIPGRRPGGRPENMWMGNILADMGEAGVIESDALNRTRWRRRTSRPHPRWD